MPESPAGVQPAAISRNASNSGEADSLQTARPLARLAQLGAARRSRHRLARGRKAWTSSQHVRTLAPHHSATVHMHDQRLRGHAAALETHSLKIKNRRSRTRFASGGRRRRAAASTSRTRRSWCSWSASVASTTCTPRWDLGFRVFAIVLVCSTFCRSLAQRCRNAMVSDGQTH